MAENNIPSKLVSHTPGPWKARDYLNGQGDIWIDCDAWKNKGRGGCLGGTLATAHKNGIGSSGSVKANALLIAAAPDLLHALRELRALVKGESPWLLEDVHMSLLVDTAISKATNP